MQLQRCASIVALAAAAAVHVTAQCAVPSASAKTLTFSILEDYDKGDDLDDIARDFALMRELGIRTWRGSLGWDDYEPARGQYDLAWLHQFAARAAAEGIVLRPYLGYTPAWAAGGADKDGQAWNQPPRDQREWRGFVAAVAKELAHHANMPSLEIYNEENVAQWWEGSRREYARTLVTASRAARAAGRFQIIAGGLVFPDTDWMEEMCAQAGGARAFDVVAVHAYPETWTPEGVTVENYLGKNFAPGFLRAVDAACGPKRVWINETGYATVAGRTERDQAGWWVRAAATFAAEPRVEHIGVYEIKDLAPGKAAIGDAPNYHLGITRADRSKKPAFATVKLLAALLGGARITSADADVSIAPVDAAGEIHHHTFRRSNGDDVLFVWNRTADQRVRFRFGAVSAVTEYALDGSVTQAAATGEVTLERGVPRVFRWRGQR